MSEYAQSLHEMGKCDWRCPYCGGDNPSQPIEEMNIKLITVLLTLILASCQAYPYVEVGAGYMSHSTSSMVLREDCNSVTLNSGQVVPCGGSSPTAHINGGVEFVWNGKHQWVDRCEISHWSHWGSPKSMEVFKDEFICYAKFGGRPAFYREY